MLLSYINSGGGSNFPSDGEAIAIRMNPRGPKIETTYEAKQYFIISVMCQSLE